MNARYVLVSLSCFVSSRNILWPMGQNDHLGVEFVTGNSNTSVTSNNILSFTPKNNQADNHMNAKYVVKCL
jgi:hypothetical protein